MRPGHGPYIRYPLTMVKFSTSFCEATDTSGSLAMVASRPVMDGNITEAFAN